MGFKKKYKGYGSRSKLYNIWYSMIKRCHKSYSPNYEYYGGRGIKVCSEWQSFEEFQKWALSNGYTETGNNRVLCTLDRINNNGDYCPENCRWATVKQQINNRTCSVFLEYNGEVHTLAEWAEIKGINYSTFFNRYSRGWSIERMLNEPVKHHVFSGKYVGDSAKRKERR